jgi:uncharacterized protein (TIGR02466 family)
MSSNNHLLFLFPQAVYIVDNLMLDSLNSFEERIKDLARDKGTNSTPFLTVQSSWSTYSKLNEDDYFKELADRIKIHAQAYLKELGMSYVAKDLDYNQMWFNISHAGEFNMPHVHNYNIISGAFYVKTSTNNKITFFKDIANMMLASDDSTELGKTNIELDCIPGRLVLFKSNMMHGTGAQLDGEKIVISFNMTI